MHPPHLLWNSTWLAQTGQRIDDVRCSECGGIRRNRTLINSDEGNMQTAGQLICSGTSLAQELCTRSHRTAHWRPPCLPATRVEAPGHLSHDLVKISIAWPIRPA